MGRQACQELGEECFRLRESIAEAPKGAKKNLQWVPDTKMWPEELGPQREKRDRGGGWSRGQGPDHTGGNLGRFLNAIGALEGV